MRARPISLEHALQLIPDVDAMIPLRVALIASSRADEARAWSGAEAYATLDMRVTTADALEESIPRLAEEARERAELLYQHVVEAVRAVELADWPRAATALVSAGELEENAGALVAAERFYQRAEEMGGRGRDRRPQGLALRRLARVAKARTAYDRALALYGRSYEIAGATRDVEGSVIACQGMGNVHMERGAWRDAEAWYLGGLTHLDSATPSRLLWQLQSNLSLVTRRAGRLEESARWVEEAKLTAERLGDSAGRVYVLTAEGLLFIAQGDAERAEAVYRDALTFAESPFEVARVLVNLSEALLLQNRLAEAEATLRRLEVVAIANHLIASLPYVYRGLGGAARARADEEGFLFYEQALQICRDESLPELELAITQLEYGEFEAEIGHLEAASARLEEARDVFARIGSDPERSRAESALRALESGANGTTRTDDNQ